MSECDIFRADGQALERDLVERPPEVVRVELAAVELVEALEVGREEDAVVRHLAADVLEDLRHLGVRPYPSGPHGLVQPRPAWGEKRRTRTINFRAKSRFFFLKFARFF